jgi:Calcineurin-like phosphoesterase
MRRIALLLTAAIGTVALLAFFYPSIMVNAADVRVEGEDFSTQPTGTQVVTNTTLYSPPDGQALKFIDNAAIAEETVTFDSEGDVVLWARGSQSGGSPTLRVRVDGGVFSPAQAITNNGAPVAYTYDLNVPAGDHTIGVQAGNTGTGRSPFLDFVTFPASGSGGTDTTPPNTTITSGPSGSLTGTTATFTFESTESGSTFLCRLLPRDPSRTPCPSTITYNNLTVGTTYTFKVWAKDAAGNIDPTPAARSFTPSGGGGGTSAILVGAGDISSTSDRDQETGNLVRTQLNSGAWGVFTTGDNAYPDGIYQNYQVYDAAWGSFKDKTRPTYGNHEYGGSSTAMGSADYWDDPPDPTPVQVSNDRSFYAYDVGNSNWRAIVLNSVNTEPPKDDQAPDCRPGSAQHEFLLRELANARTNNKNTVLFWHHARFSASTDHPTSEGEDGCSFYFFDAAHDYGADLVVQGHSHVYERYHARDKNGTRAASGLTSIVCGAGGNSSDGLQGSPSPTPDVKFTNTWGICKLTLNTNSAEVRYLEAPNSPGAPVDIATVARRP